MARPVAGVLVLRTDGPLVFANVDPVVDDLRRLALRAQPRPGVVVLDFEATYEIDVTAATTLARLVHDLLAEGIDSGSPRPVRRYGTTPPAWGSRSSRA